MIRKLDIAFGEGFNVLTGETGAGKSILIDSVSFLLGGKVQKNFIRTGEDRATVSAVFSGLTGSARDSLDALGISQDDGELMVSRVLSADGKQISRINGQTVSASLLRQAGHILLSIHGQNDNQAVLQKANHQKLLDSFGSYDAQLAAYRSAYAVYRDISSQVQDLTKNEQELLQLKDILTYQIKDIEQMHLVDGEEEKLVKERDHLANIEKISKMTDLIYRILYGSEKGSVSVLLDKAAIYLQQLSDYEQKAAQYADKLKEMRYSLQDIAEWANDIGSTDEGDPTARIDEIEGRLDGISKLERKYGGDIAHVLRFCAEAKEKLEKFDNSTERLEKLQKELTAAKKVLDKASAELTTERSKAANVLTGRVIEELVQLDMPKVRFSVSIGQSAPEPDGCDDIEFLIATNPGEPLMPMIKIASGGELSRIMLALKTVINDNDEVGTAIYDEVDSGISGKTSRKVGFKLKKLSSGSQIICVTHSAQIASLADHHYLICKQEESGRAVTDVQELDREGRIGEIARILGGLNVTDTQRKAAEELMDEKNPQS
ncbi:MAG: DNA repair protein RecN [Clostridia bacterium]|nr:DNA repair protein RecN [Clostridia bacterium]